jgi:cell division protein ZapD
LRCTINPPVLLVLATQTVLITSCYEQPLNERVRLLLRLEFLFEKVTQTATGQSVWDSRTALQGLFEILSLTGRNEVRSELLKELERHAASLGRLRQSPGVDTGILDTILQDIAQAVDGLRGQNNLVLEAVRRTDFLSAIRQRSGIPGGTCQFDLPALHYWLQQDSTVRTYHLTHWLEPLQPMQEAVNLILGLIRDSALPRQAVAVRGFFQQALDSTAPNQLVRVMLSSEQGVFPEISGGRHRVSIRFMEQPDPNQRAGQSTEDIDFWLVCCVI